MKIRRFHPADLHQVRRLVLEGLGEHFGFIDETINPDLDDIQGTYVDSGGAFFVAVEGEEIVGTGCLLPVSDTEGRIVRMSTAARYRRKGIASAVFDAIMREAARRGLQRIVIATEPHWKDAVGFYRSKGFVPCGGDETDIFMKCEVGSMK